MLQYNRKLTKKVSLFYATFLATTTFAWGWMFYKKDYHPQPLGIIFKSFLGGSLSMIPLFCYRYIYENYFPEIASYQIFKPLFDSFLLSGVVYFLHNLVILFLLLTLLTGVLSITLTFFKHEVLENILTALKSEELEFVSVSLMIGVLIYLERIFEGVFNMPIVATLLGGILFLTVIEEYVKHLVVRFIDDKRISDVDDAITLSIVAGLAFAFIETIIYALNAHDWGLILPRSLMSIPIHVISSGIFGYYYGLAHFAKPIAIASKNEKTCSINFKWLHWIYRVKRSTIYKQEKIVQGLVLATAFHAFANVLFEMNLTFIVIPLIAVGLTLLTRLYKESQIIYRLLAFSR